MVWYGTAWCGVAWYDIVEEVKRRKREEIKKRKKKKECCVCHRKDYTMCVSPEQEEEQDHE